ncbi:hypothetical protein HU200_032803 [Digitaria exilis]|uniref:Uncharacterized protein n=1 Tax=Digitaria exilis TaxID=1010633 RepID=A0A835BNA9_9POAL|nr:hypothetical protein HU200_032803 [Digitaria exilis]
MISSINLFGSSQKPALNFYRRCLPNNAHFAPTMHSVPKSMCKAMIIKRARLKPHASDINRNPQAHELYKLVYRLPENLSWLLEPPEIPKRLTSKKKRQKDEIVTSEFGVILEWEGVVVEDDDPDLEPRVWYVLSLEEAKSFPPDALLKKIEGMRTDQAISEVLCWSEDPEEIKRLAARKEVIYQKLQGGYYKLRPEQLGLEPDVCLVFGNSNLTTESAHAAGMRCVAIAGRHPAYELQAANHVVRWLDQLSIVDLQRLVNGEAIGRRGRESDMDMEIVIEE